MSSALNGVDSPPSIPRHLGLTRRQSYDLTSTLGHPTSHAPSLSTSRVGQGLSLGKLPAPSFSALPHGQRSVPALEASSSSRLFGLHSNAGPSGSSSSHGGFRSVSGNGPFSDGQRTPGGSLVVGAEIFGFGSSPSSASSKLAKDRWADTSALSTTDTPRSSLRALQLDDDSNGGWPSEFATSSSKSSASTSKTNHTRHGVDSSSADLTLTGLPRPNLKSSGSSMELRTTTPFASLDDEPVRIPTRPNASRAATGLPLEAKLNTKVPTVQSPLSATELGSRDRGMSKPSTPSYNSKYESPAAEEYFSSTIGGSSALKDDGASSTTNGNSGRTLQASGFTALAPGPHQMSPDELSFSMQGLNVNGNSTASHDDRRQNSTGSTTTRGSFSANGGREPPSRQSSGGFPPFFVPPHASPADPYAQSNFDAAAYFHPGGVGDYHGIRRDSGYAPSLQSTASSNNIPPTHGQGLHPFDSMARGMPQQQSLSQQHQGSPNGGVWPVAYGGDYGANPNARHGAFSPTGMPPLTHQVNMPPSMYGMPPRTHQGGTANSPFEAPTPVFQPAQLNQQHQIILGRGLRSSVDYIAPGPLGSGGQTAVTAAAPVGPGGSMYGTGYATGYGHGYGAAETMGRALRSPLLEEFRTSRHRVWELGDILGHIVEFSGDQLGSRFIQQKLELASTEDRGKVFEEVLPNLLQLSTDVFANYVIQKLFEQAPQLQKTAMANVLEGHVLQLSLQMYGCRVVQKALEYVLVDQQVKLIKELDGHVLKCARDAQSNHVIQRALERVPSNKLTFITDACVGQVHNLATHPYGCRVLQRIFENCPAAQAAPLMEELHRSMQVLIQDQYGNYVVQWVIEKGDPAERSKVVARIMGQVLPFSQQKFASNVVEKCIVNATDQERSLIIDEVLTPLPDGSSIIKAMLIHPYANYVVQKILNTSSGPQRDILFNEVEVQLTNIRKFSASSSKHLISIEKLLANERAARGMLY
ncbi:mRNA binding protein puf3 [Microbotryomycetes sp. JL221]|nr:mRNA binding protein puf3 [Microbotryomycetes sp. JL221]